MPQQQAGYKAAILSLSFLSLTLQRGTGPYKGWGEGHGGHQRSTMRRYSTSSVLPNCPSGPAEINR